MGTGSMVASIALAAAVSVAALFHSYTFHIFDSKNDVRIVAVGDLFFDRYIRQSMYLRGDDYPLSCARELFDKGSFVFGNLEGPITTHSSRSVGTLIGSPDNYVFTFPTSTAAVLARHNFRVVNLGNNHITNFGLEGLASTREFLTAAGVGSFGGVAGTEPVYRLRERNIPIAFVSYNQFGGQSAGEVADLIKVERLAGNRVIVMAHWGDEYSTDISSIKPVAKLFADRGASAVIGSHPHIVLGHEYIGSTLVYYSLGNFIFDQYFNPSVMRGLALVLHVSHSGFVTADEYPVVMSTDGRTCLTATEEK